MGSIVDDILAIDLAFAGIHRALNRGRLSHLGIACVSRLLVSDHRA